MTEVVAPPRKAFAYFLRFPRRDFLEKEKGVSGRVAFRLCQNWWQVWGGLSTRASRRYLLLFPSSLTSRIFSLNPIGYCGVKFLSVIARLPKLSCRVL